MIYYQNIIDNNISPKPNEQYRNDIQASIDWGWDNTSAKYTVQEENTIGGTTYTDIDVWIDYVVADGSSPFKNGDDFRRFIFQDITHEVIRGQYYKFDDNYWIGYFTDEYSGLVKSINVRRCNNFLRWVDPDIGAIKSVPCVIDYDIGSSRPKQDKDIIVADNSMVIIVQGNEDTKKLKQNQRFLFNGRPFKLAGFNNALLNGVVDNSTNLFYYDLYLDVIQPTDDVQNNIANRYEYNYTVDIIQDVMEQVNGFSGKLNTTVTFNNEVVDRDITWVGNQFVTVDNNGNYTLNGAVGDVATIRAYITGNPDIYDEISIGIVNAVVDSYEIVAEPLYAELKQGQTVTFNVKLYKNGVAQADVVNATLSGAPSTAYTFSMVNNVCTLKCNGISTTPLSITFTSGQHNKTISIKLKSAF